VRHTADRGALRRARDILHGGGVLFIYPEGHRGWDGRLQRAEPGAAFLARSARVPVLPVGIVGTNDCLPPGAKLPRRRRVELHFGAPFLLRDRLPDGTKIGNQEAADAIMLAVATLLPPAMHGAYADPALLPAAAAGATEPTG
jgi:1-acyl-sn-glycerol-3-phosphate acyltransferase